MENVLMVGLMIIVLLIVTCVFNNFVSKNKVTKIENCYKWDTDIVSYGEIAAACFFMGVPLIINKLIGDGIIDSPVYIVILTITWATFGGVGLIMRKLYTDEPNIYVIYNTIIVPTLFLSNLL